MSWKRGSSGEMSEDEEENCDVLRVDDSEFLDEEALLQIDADDGDPDACTNDDLLEGDGDDQMPSSPQNDEALIGTEACVGNSHNDVTVKGPTQERPVSREQNKSGKAEPNYSGAPGEAVSESEPSATQTAREPRELKGDDIQQDCPSEESPAEEVASTAKKAVAIESRPCSDLGRQHKESHKDRRGGAAPRPVRAAMNAAGNESPQPAAGKPTARGVNKRRFNGSLPNRPGAMGSQQATGYPSRQQHLRGRGGGTQLQPLMRPADLRTSALPLSGLAHPTPNSQQTDLQHLLNVLTAAAAASAPMQGMAGSQQAFDPASPPFVSPPRASAQAAHVHMGPRGPAALPEQQPRFLTQLPVQQELLQQTSSRPYGVERHVTRRAFSANGDGSIDSYEHQGSSGQNNRDMSPIFTSVRADTDCGSRMVDVREDGEEKVQIDYNHGTGDCDYRILHLQQQQRYGTAADNMNRGRGPNLHRHKFESSARKQERDFSGAPAGEQNPEARASPGRSRLENSRQDASGSFAAATESDPVSRHQPKYDSTGSAKQFPSMEGESLSGSTSGNDVYVAGVDDDYLKRLRLQELRREEIVRHKEAQRQREAERKRLELGSGKPASTNQSTPASGDTGKRGPNGSTGRQPAHQNTAKLHQQSQTRYSEQPLHKMPAMVDAGEKGITGNRAAASNNQDKEPATKRMLVDARPLGAAYTGTKWLAADASGKSPAEKQLLLRQRLLQLQQQSGLKRKLGTTTEGSQSQPGNQLTPACAFKKRDVSGSSSSSKQPVLPTSLPVKRGQQPTISEEGASAGRAVHRSPQMSAWHAQRQHLHQQHRQESVEHAPVEGASNWSSSQPSQYGCDDTRSDYTHSDWEHQSQRAPEHLPVRPYLPAVHQSDDTRTNSAHVPNGATSVCVKNISASTPLVTLCMHAAMFGRVNNAFFINDAHGQAILEFATEAAADMFCRKYNNCTMDHARITATLVRR